MEIPFKKTGKIRTDTVKQQTQKQRARKGQKNISLNLFLFGNDTKAL